MIGWPRSLDAKELSAIDGWMAKIAGWPGPAGYHWMDGQDPWMSRTFQLLLDEWPRLLYGQDLQAIAAWMAKIAGRLGFAGYRLMDG